ncbi:hypothetical protein [Corynebacterium vitaeruminis]|uniref:hypothetical protein n=1 Tax=Corynebacterium vitaeruminis TaxID=38305 RepID=UPI000ADC5B89|nr:hypothetical protein [Corynebacterium vitaeruminis]
MEIFHHKQPFNPTGNVFANSVTRTMKGQSLSIWDMFTRETLQNSWDARDTASDEDGVTFAIDYRDLSSEQLQILRNNVFNNDFEGLQELTEAMASGKLSCLLVSDSGTNGLRGPTSASSTKTKYSDFISFVRNIGRSDSKKMAGGTYGFGKGVFFISSTVSTIVVYTRTIDENGSPVSRLIAMANGDDFEANGVSYTGRHWWGRRATEEVQGNRNEYAEPLINQDADWIAKILGMDAYFTADRRTGTSIMVLNPDISNDEGVDDMNGMMEQITRSLTRWAWPHMVRKESHLDPIEFHVSANGEALEIPDPMKDPALKHFVMSYSSVLDMKEGPNNSWEDSFPGLRTAIWSGSPKKRLGGLAINYLTTPISQDETVIEEDVSSHIAMLRLPRMVVEYHKGPTNMSGRNYCGVFIADDKADPVFARSEPAAHHQWNFQTVSHDTELLAAFWGRTSKSNPVRIFYDKISDLLKNTDRSFQKSGDERHFQSVTTLADDMGRMISNATSGTSARNGGIVKVKKNSKPKPPTKKSRASIVDVKLRKQPEGIVAVFKIHGEFIDDQPLPLTVTPTVLSDTGNILNLLKESGSDIPRILGIYDFAPLDPAPWNWEESAESLQVELTRPRSDYWIAISQPEQTAVSLNIKISEPKHEGSSS